MALSPTQRSLKYLRAAGYVCGITEHWHQPPGAAFGVRRDLFGIIDVAAVGHGELLLVQTTSVTNVRARVRKCLDPAQVSTTRALLLVPGVCVHIHGWDALSGMRPLIVDLAVELAAIDAQPDLPF